MPKRIEKCVEKVKRKKGVKSAWAICSASTGIKKKKGGGWTKGKPTKKKRMKKK